MIYWTTNTLTQIQPYGTITYGHYYVYCIRISTAKGQKIDASQEMIAIGTSNLLGSFVSSFPVTGSFSRTAVNAASGVRTPLNGIFTGALYPLFAILIIRLKLSLFFF